MVSITLTREELIAITRHRKIVGPVSRFLASEDFRENIRTFSISGKKEWKGLYLDYAISIDNSDVKLEVNI
ncbi:MAG: hypothetical protein JXR97_00585 [Planctomycetes bacterium]|nr:hypothetical protein [Planctomycetota bacterium]